MKTKLLEGTKLHEEKTAGMVNFARKQFCTEGHFCTRAKKTEKKTYIKNTVKNN